ncbi:MAG: hypothetical protein DBX47_06375 [Clostridiales bacterium]|nr:MAG: hypothetical protein DBX47_06375 [Clostridiales bacterium]
MKLTPEEQEIFDGKQGKTLQKVMRTIVQYGEIFGADKLVPISGPGHLVTSFGISLMTATFDVMQDLIDAGLKTKEPFTVDPRPIDNKNVPSNLLQKVVAKVMYGKQKDYEEQLKALGLKDDNAFTCACYLPQVGNTPKKGDILSWAESSAVVYANSVLGARCNRNSAFIDLFGAILGKVPNFGLLTDEGRKATWVIDVRCKKKPEAQVLGSAIGLKVMEDVPYIKGLDEYLHTLDDDACAYLKDMGAATASNGAVGLYHVDKITPEAVELSEELIAEGARTYIIDDEELERVKASYPIMWADKNAKPALAFIGCPHLTINQLVNWTERIETSLNKNGIKKVCIKTVLCAAPDVIDTFKTMPEYQRLLSTGAKLTYICPLMYMNNPKCKAMPIITCSNKLRTYTVARYGTEDEILSQITKGAN